MLISHLLFFNTNSEIPNPKHQITNKSQIPILVLRTPHPAGGSPVSMIKTGLEFEISVIVICLIFMIWNLEFRILQYFVTPKMLAIFTGTAA